MSSAALAAKNTAPTTGSTPTTDITDLQSFLANEIDRWRSGSMSNVPEVQAHIGDLERYHAALRNHTEKT